MKYKLRLLSVLRGHSVFSFPPQPPMNSDFKGFFYLRFYPLHLFSFLNSRERASIFLFECSVLNKGTTGTIFITSLVWRGPWLGIEPGTFRTRSQHYTTRLSRRRYTNYWKSLCVSLYCVSLYCVSLYCVSLYYVSLYCVSLYCVSLYCVSLYCVSLYCVSLYCVSLYCVAVYTIASWWGSNSYHTNIHCLRVRCSSQCILAPLIMSNRDCKSPR